MDSKQVINNIADWLVSITQDMELKKEKIPETRNYKYTLVPPAVYRMTCPPREEAGDGSAPSITVKVEKGSLNKGEGKLTVRLELETWNTGIHSNDFVNITHVEAGTDKVELQTNEKEVAPFKKNYDGWQDIMSLIERIVGALDADEQAAGVRRVSDISYVFPFEDKPFVSCYPSSYATITYDVEYQSFHANTAYQDILN